MLLLLHLVATMLCGYGSGVVQNVRQGTIERRIIAHYLPFTAPAVIVGGQVGPRIAWHLNARALRLYVAAILTLVGVLMLTRFALTTDVIR